MLAANTLSVRSITAVVAACSLMAACSKQDDRAGSTDAATANSADAGRIAPDPKHASGGARALHGTPTFAEGADGSVSIHTRNGAMVMSLRHDSVVVAFSDSVRAAVKSDVRKKMDKDSATGSALGQVIHGVVQSSVSGALREVFEKARGFPVSTLRDLSYDQGAIRFHFVEKPTWSFDGFESDGEPILAQFHPADAARFVGAVRAKLK